MTEALDLGPSFDPEDSTGTTALTFHISDIAGITMLHGNGSSSSSIIIGGSSGGSSNFTSSGNSGSSSRGSDGSAEQQWQSLLGWRPL